MSRQHAGAAGARAAARSVPLGPPGPPDLPAGAPRHRGSLPAPVPRAGGAPRRTRRDPLDGDREREDAGVRRGVRGSRPHRAEGHGALPVPDEGARPRSAPGRPRPEAHADPRVGLRRRHAEGGTTAGPQERQPRPDEPRHAPPLDPPGPRTMGGLLLPALPDRDRRGARVPRGVRLTRGDGPAAAPTADRALRGRPALVPGERHGGQPGRAGLAADRSRRRGRRGGRRAGR